MNYDKWIDKAEQQIRNLSCGYTFVLKDLFKGVEWDELQKGQKIYLGKKFKNAVTEGRFEGIRYIGKAENNSAKYQKE